jgi:hypothetical protein
MQAGLFFAHLETIMPENAKENVFRISTLQSTFSEIITIARLKNHFQSKGLYIIQETEKLPEEQQAELIMAAENAVPKKGIVICFLLSPAEKSGKKGNVHNVTHFQEEKKKKKSGLKIENIIAPDHLIEMVELNEKNMKKDRQYLPALISHLFHLHNLPDTPMLVAEFINAFSNNPLSMLNEAKKLSVLSKEPQFSRPDNLLETLKKPETGDIWRFLDGMGLRNIKRVLSDLNSLNIKQREEATQAFNLVKSHFRKILFLKNLIPDTEKRQLIVNANSFFRARNHWQKKGLMEENRQILMEKISQERQKSLFNRYFKSDYYLAKMLWQQNRFSTEELLQLMTSISETGIKIRYSNQPPENIIFGFVNSFCK